MSPSGLTALPQLTAGGPMLSLPLRAALRSKQLRDRTRFIQKLECGSISSAAALACAFSSARQEPDHP
jgi:hypothetical protein